MGWSTNLALAGWALLALHGTLGCKSGRGSRPRLTFPTSPAVGRPSTCPDDAVDPGGVGPAPGAMDVRCSYADASGGGLVQLRGKVLLEADPGSIPEPAAQMRLTVHRADGDGEPLGRTTTDTQGSYSVSLKLTPGEYVLRAAAEDSGGSLASRTIVVPEGATNMAGLDLILRLDSRARPGPDAGNF